MKNALKKFKDLFFEEEEYEEIVDDGIEEEPVVAVEPVFQDIRLDKEEKEEEQTHFENCVCVTNP